MPADHEPDTGRRAFLRNACFAGLCAGVPAGDADATAVRRDGADESELPSRWIAAVLPALGTLDEAQARAVVGSGAAAHYAQLDMDQALAPFVGDLPAFFGFLREWGWIVEYDAQAGVVMADENKDHCVCPFVPADPPEGLGALCHCSAAFSERMFSTVTRAPARAEVVESILRGGSRCRYRVELSVGDRWGLRASG